MNLTRARRIQLATSGLLLWRRGTGIGALGALQSMITIPCQ